MVVVAAAVVAMFATSCNRVVYDNFRDDASWYHTYERNI